MVRIPITVALIGAIFAAAGHAQAPRRRGRAAPAVPATTGLLFGAHTVLAAGTTIDGRDIDAPFHTSLGQGVGVQVGYGLTPRLMGFASFDLARQGSQVAWVPGSLGLTHFEIGGRMSFPRRGRRVVPYLTAVLGRRGISGKANEDGERYSLKLTGTEIGAGGGVLYALSPMLSLDAALMASRGKFSRGVFRGDYNDDLRLDLDNTTTWRLKVGFQWAPR